VPLNDDQKAMLRLLAQREEGYADIAALKGMTVADVRAQVRAALDELAAEPEPPAPEPAVPDPPAPPVQPPAPLREAPPPQSGSKSPRPRRTAPAIPPERRRVLALAAGAVALVAVVLAVIAIAGGGNDASSGTDTQQVTPASTGRRATQSVLKGINGNGASGQALFGRTGQEVVLAVGATGLQPSPSGHSYAISVVRSPSQRVPIAAAPVDKSGKLTGQFVVAPAVLGLLASGYDRMEVSLVLNRELRRALAQAQRQKAPPRFDGRVALRGKITGPITERSGQ
jgi:hypothetical protein